MTMQRIVGSISAAVLASAALSVVVAAPADAAVKKYSSCAKLTKDFPHGVSRSKKAANKQVAAGYGKPASGTKAKKVYRKNKANLDRDDDGTACER